MKYAVAALLLLIANNTRADDSAWKWTTMDTIGQVAITTLLVMDRNQTIRIGRDGLESNAILGKSPSARAVNTYFISYALLSTGLSLALPKPYRNIVQGITIGYQFETVRYNAYGFGTKYSIKF
jgi:hypothetical protein